MASRALNRGLRPESMRFGTNPCRTTEAKDSKTLRASSYRPVVIINPRREMNVSRPQHRMKPECKQGKQGGHKQPGWARVSIMLQPAPEHFLNGRACPYHRLTSRARKDPIHIICTPPLPNNNSALMSLTCGEVWHACSQ